MIRGGISEKVKNHENPIIWQKGIEAFKEIYRIVREFPKEETYVLGD